MRREILYLSVLEAEAALLFPNELPDAYYAPGLFIAEQDVGGSLAYAYSFDAMDNEQRVSLKLVRYDEADPNANLYVVRTEHYGSFWFSLDRINPAFRYKGGKQRLRDHADFRVAVTRDSQKLERVCKEFDFYFIGSTLDEDEPG